MNAVHSPQGRATEESATDRRGRVSVFRRAQDWLRHRGDSDEAAILNALPAHVAVLDAQGTILSVNFSWRQFEASRPSFGPGPKVGRNYVDICDSAPEADANEARLIAAGIRSVLAGVSAIFTTDYPCHSSSEQRWFALTVTPLGDGPTRGAIIMHRDITAERHLSYTLRASELRFRQMAESMREVFFLIDASSHQLLYISPAYEAVWGRTSHTLDTERPPWTVSVHPDDRDFAQKEYDKGILAGTFAYECRILRPDGSVRWIEVRGSPVVDTAGLLLRVAGIVEDITHRKQALQALHESRRRLDSFVMAATDAIVTLDEDFRVVLSNPAAESMFGYTTAGLRGQPLHALLSETVRAPHPPGAANEGDAPSAAAPMGTARAVTVFRKDGQKFQSEASISTFNANGRRYFTATLRDLTDRRQALGQLRESQRRLSDLLGNVEMVAVIIDRTGTIDYCNDYLLKLTGWKREEILGKSLLDLFMPADRRHEMKGVYAAMLANLPGSRHHENTMLTRTGEERLIRWSNSVLRSVEGEVIGIASIGEDITEQQRSDIRLKRLSRIYTVLSQINALILRVRDRRELFSEACRIAVDAGMFSMAWIGVIDSQTSEGKVVAWHGGKAEYVSGIHLTALEGLSKTERPACRALRQARPVICNDIATDPSVLFLRNEFLTRGHKSLGCFPLIVAGRPTAVLALYAAEPDAFDEGESRLLLELAGNISFALDHLEKQERLNYLASYDELTGLANRGLFLQRVTQVLRAADAGGDTVALGLIDLERFKNINQSLGRASGDALLQQVAEWLAHTLGEMAFLARIGADHFAVVIPTNKSEAELGRMIERKMEVFLRHPFRLNESVFHISAKVGVALYPGDGADADVLFRHAEAALRKAKMAGDRYVFYAPRMTETVVVRLNLENMLREALYKEQFELYYQPKVHLLSGKLTGAEALIRWNDPRTGLVLPAKFIPILEETGLIHEVGRWVLHKAIEDYARWCASGLPAVRIAVNVSALQLRSRGFIDQVKHAVAVDAAAASGLELEVTESVIMEDVRHSGVSLRAIRAMGVSIAIDDFGTGFSSLSYLSKLPLDTLKIDRSFVHDMTAGRQGTELVSAIIRLAHSLKLNVVAEGVETQQQSALLHALGCDESQGYLFGRPAPCALFESTYLVPMTVT
jgi:diguanylate cyclase (GGDEF)-like protein/PAS domain S-box-containing protein